MDERQTADVLGYSLHLPVAQTHRDAGHVAEIVVAFAALEVRQLIDHIVGLLSRQTRIAESSGYPVVMAVGTGRNSLIIDAVLDDGFALFGQHLIRHFARRTNLRCEIFGISLDLRLRQALGQRVHGIKRASSVFEIMKLFDDVSGVKPRQFWRHHARYGGISGRAMTGFASGIRGTGIISQGGGAQKNAGHHTQRTQNH